MPISGARNDLQVVRGTHRVGEHEIAVAGNIQMRFELLFRDVLESCSGLSGVSSRVGFGKKRCKKLIDWVPSLSSFDRHIGGLTEREIQGPVNIKGTVARNFGRKRRRGHCIGRISVRAAESIRSCHVRQQGGKGSKSGFNDCAGIPGSAERPMFKSELIEREPTARLNLRVEEKVAVWRVSVRLPAFSVSPIYFAPFSKPPRGRIPCGRSP